MRDIDIVERLNQRWTASEQVNDYRFVTVDKYEWMSCAGLTREAATEIQRLREELRVMTDEHRLACEDRDLMMRERDEARRMVCALDADIMEDQREYARHRGWDCFERLPHAD